MPSTPSSALPEPPWRRSRWKSFVVGILGALVVGGVAAALLAIGSDADNDTGPTGRAPSGGVADAGDRAPDFRLQTLDGETIQLSDLRGSPVVVNFWASWCNPCREEFPLLARALDEHRKEGLRVVGVTFRDIESDSSDFVDEMDATWPQGVDDGGAVARAFGVRTVPVSFFVDADGVIAARLFGFSSPTALSESLSTILPPPGATPPSGTNGRRPAARQSPTR